MKLPSNWKSRIEIVEEARVAGEYEFTIKFKQGKTPKGFPKIIGYLQVSFSKPNVYWVDSVELKNKFIGRGLGTMLYEKAINEFGSLTTNYHRASEPAQWLWKSLCKSHQYSMDFFKGTLTVYK